jgi:predicted enzyme related to lactoylglutathione lyase
MTAHVITIRATLEVRDVPTSIEFYRAALGLEPAVTMGEPPTFALLAGGSALLGLSQEGQPAVASIAALYVDVDDVEAAFSRCAEAGLAVAASLTTHPWGMRDFVLRDPDGHQVAVGQRLADRPQ